MKKAIIVVICLVSLHSLIYAVNNKTLGIILNKEERTLSAPLATQYQWYLNNEKLSQTGREIQFEGDGNYTVDYIDNEGEIHSANITLATNAEGKIYVIYIIGDSTACNWASGFYPKTGWGQVLSHFFDANVSIQNRARSARSAKSYYNETEHWPTVKNLLQPGDYVFIQFGINDATKTDPARYTEPFTTFKEYLTLYVNETKAKGAIPVLLTTIRRNRWNETNPPTLYPAYHDYPVATRQLAQEINVPLIDLDQLTIPLLEGLGPDYVGPFMYMHLDAGEYPNYATGQADQVHLQEMGAIEMARLVVEALEGMGADTNINKLIPHIKPRKEITVSTNFPDASIITRTASYPSGINVTLKAKINSAYGFKGWIDTDSNIISTSRIYQFKMDTVADSIIALLDDDPYIDCAGVMYGSAYKDSCEVCVGGNTKKSPCTSEIEEGVYKITTANYGLCIEEDSMVIQQSCALSNSQFWEFIKEGDNYKIKNTGSGMYLYTKNINSLSYLSTDTQSIQWRLEKVESDIFQLSPVVNTSLIFEVYGNRSTTGLQLRLYTRTGANNQKFKIWKLDPQNCEGYPCLAINNVELSNHYISTVPNPFTFETQLSLKNMNENNFSFILYDIQGVKVFQKDNIIENEIRFGSELSKGIYIGKVIFENKTMTVKIIKR